MRSQIMAVNNQNAIKALVNNTFSGTLLRLSGKLSHGL